MLFCSPRIKILAYHQLLNKKEGKDKKPFPPCIANPFPINV